MRANLRQAGLAQKLNFRSANPRLANILRRAKTYCGAASPGVNGCRKSRASPLGFAGASRQPRCGRPISDAIARNRASNGVARSACRSSNASNARAAGLLAAPLPRDKVPAPRNWYLVYMAEHKKLRKIRAFQASRNLGFLTSGANNSVVRRRARVSF